jgi:hypothetical protein
MLLKGECQCLLPEAHPPTVCACLQSRAVGVISQAWQGRPSCTVPVGLLQSFVWLVLDIESLVGLVRPADTLRWGSVWA